VALCQPGSRLRRSARQSSLVCRQAFGLGVARSLLARGWRVFGSVRSAADAEAARTALGSERFTPLLFDVTDDAAVAAAAAHVAAVLGPCGTLGALVNNSGVCHAGPLALMPLPKAAETLNVNVLGALRVTQHFLPLMGTDLARTGRPGRVVNVSSVAGSLVSPFMAVYAASKHALEAMSHALRREMLPFGIEVVIVAPGAVDTPLLARLFDACVQLSVGTPYEAAAAKLAAMAVGPRAPPMFSAAQMGDLVAAAVEQEQPRVRYLHVCGWRRYLMNYLMPVTLPHRWLDKLLGAGLGLNKPVTRASA
jgi:NAD(P)-dependent dehydrogenase (short-subunit alcohol dehydrogenase family)